MHQPRHLLHVFSTFGVGGPEVRTCDLINHFGDRYRHTILAMDNNYECRSKLVADAPVTFAEMTNHRQNLRKNVQQFADFLRTQKPDVLLTYNWGAVEWGLANLWTRTCRHIHGEDGFGPDEVHQQKKRRIYARRLFLARAHKIIVPSRLLAKIICESWHFPATRVSYIPNGVDINKFSRCSFSPPEKQNLWGLPITNETTIIGTVARLRAEKNIALMIRAFAKATAGVDACLLVVGSGVEEAALRQIIHSENLTEKVFLLGHRDDPSEVITTFDIFALSSDTEQMPISILEAMAAGRPIVGTHVGDIKDMVASSNQEFLSAARDENAFAQNLARLIASRELQTKIGHDNYDRCRAQFDKSVMFNNYQQLYDGN